jgi:hypothetical protein
MVPEGIIDHLLRLLRRERNKESNEGRGSVFRFLFSGVCTE